MNDPITWQDNVDVGGYDDVLGDLSDLTAAVEADPADIEQHRGIPFDDEPDR